MMLDTKLLTDLLECLKAGKSAVLIRIIRRKGSAPRGVGSSCVVDAAGDLHGTIGGGLLEYRAIEAAKQLFTSGTSSVISLELTAKEIEKEGMICGGRVELYLEPLQADPHTLKFFTAAADIVHAGQRGTLVTRIKHGAHVSSSANRMLLIDEKYVFGTPLVTQIPPQYSRSLLLEKSDVSPTLFVEPIQQNPELLVFGGGHIGTFVSSLAKMVGFRVSIFDDRGEYANRERFPDADAIYAMPYDKAFEKITITGASYIVIVTRGHMGDKGVLEHVLRSDAAPAYVGMIGSIKKRDALYQAMIESGTREKELTGIYSPIGLDIGAQTPEEIAVSILAEIIQVKAGI